MGPYIHRGELEEEIKKLLQDKSIEKKLVCLSGVSQIGKTFTLQYIEKHMMGNYLCLSLSLNSNNVSNPIFLKESIFRLVKDAGIDKQRNSNAKDIIASIFKGITVSSPLVEFNGESLIIELQSALEQYLSKIKNSLGESNLYIEKLADIVVHVAQKRDCMIYLLIDNIHFADEEILAFLDVLLLKNIPIGFFLTYDKSISSKRLECIDNLVDKFLTSASLDKTIEPFLKRSTKKYLKAKGPIENLDALTDTLHLYTAGIPGYISVLSDNLKELDKIAQIPDFKKMMEQLYRKCSDGERKILEYISVSGDQIHKDILFSISEIDSIIDFEKSIESLIEKRGMLDENEEFYIIKLPNLVGQLKSMAKKRINTNLYNAYMISSNAFKSKYEYIYFQNIIMLTNSLEKEEEYLDNVIKGASYFRKHFKYQIASDILEECFKKDNFDLKIHCELFIQYVETKFAMKQMDKIIEKYNLLSEDMLQEIDTNYSFIKLIIGKAYYYLNMADDAICIVKTVESDNEIDKLDKLLIICSSHDLNGSYEESIITYQNFVVNQNFDEQSTNKLNVVSQMFEDDFQTCIENIHNGILYFEKIKSPTIQSLRTLATAYNNVGIEYLMNGEDRKAFNYLTKSKKYFLDYLPLEIHFPLNNLGLYYLLVEQNSKIALENFNEALSRAISPLQKSYICQNIFICYYIENDLVNAFDYLNRASDFIGKCPDPIAQNYFRHNQAFYNSKINEPYERIPYLSKKQLDNLNIKRAAINHENYELKNVSDRRKFFLSFEFEPCELMFYN